MHIVYNGLCLILEQPKSLDQPCKIRQPHFLDTLNESVATLELHTFLTHMFDTGSAGVVVEGFGTGSSAGVVGVEGSDDSGMEVFGTGSRAGVVVAEGFGVGSSDGSGTGSSAGVVGGVVAEGFGVGSSDGSGVEVFGTGTGSSAGVVEAAAALKNALAIVRSAPPTA